MAEAASHRVQVGVRSQELGGRVVPELFQRAGDADPAGVAPVPVRRRVGVSRLTSGRIREEREGVCRDFDALGSRLCTAAPKALLE